jgi:hypothetical protein
MRIQTVILLLLQGLLLTTCYKPLDFDPSAHKPQMVVSGVLVPGRDAWVRLTASIPIEDTASVIPITNATVALYRGDIHLGYFTHDSVGFYSLSTPLHEGETYTLWAECDGYPSLEAQTTIPRPVSFSIAKSMIPYNPYTTLNHSTLSIQPVSDIVYFAFLSYKLSLRDTSYLMDHSSGYYLYLSNIHSRRIIDSRIEFFDLDLRTERYLNDFTTYSSALNFYTHFPEKIGALTISTVFFSNDMSIGDSLTFSAYYHETYFGLDDPIIYLNLYQLCPNLYKTFRGFAAQRETNNMLFVTPVSTYNSIRGGLGYFGSCLVHTVRFRYENGQWNKENSNAMNE